MRYADNLCIQFVPRSRPTEPFDMLMFFFKKSAEDKKKSMKNTQHPKIESKSTARVQRSRFSEHKIGIISFSYIFFSVTFLYIISFSISQNIYFGCSKNPSYYSLGQVECFGQLHYGYLLVPLFRYKYQFFSTSIPLCLFSLSYDVTSGSATTPYIKIYKPLVV